MELEYNDVMETYDVVWRILMDQEQLSPCGVTVLTEVDCGAQRAAPLKFHHN